MNSLRTFTNGQSCTVDGTSVTTNPLSKLINIMFKSSNIPPAAMNSMIADLKPIEYYMNKGIDGRQELFNEIRLKKDEFESIWKKCSENQKEVVKVDNWAKEFDAKNRLEKITLISQGVNANLKETEFAKVLKLMLDNEDNTDVLIGRIVYNIDTDEEELCLDNSLLTSAISILTSHEHKNILSKLIFKEKHNIKKIIGKNTGKSDNFVGYEGHNAIKTAIGYKNEIALDIILSIEDNLPINEKIIDSLIICATFGRANPNMMIKYIKKIENSPTYSKYKDYLVNKINKEYINNLNYIKKYPKSKVPKKTRPYLQILYDHFINKNISARLFGRSRSRKTKKSRRSRKTKKSRRSRKTKIRN